MVKYIIFHISKGKNSYIFLRKLQEINALSWPMDHGLTIIHYGTGNISAISHAK